jgi:hypothetical protein
MLDFARHGCVVLKERERKVEREVRVDGNGREGRNGAMVIVFVNRT